MATLISPGVSISVIDESTYLSAGQGTIPFIIVATAQDKTTPSGSSIAEGTLKENANELYLVTSQRDLLNTFGDPIFRSSNGVPMHGSPLNEYGLLAAYSYLGIANRAYILRADIPLNQLEATSIEPTNPAEVGTYWFDTDDSEFGLFELVADPIEPTEFVWKPAEVSIVFIGAPNNATGQEGDYAVAIETVGTDTNMIFYKKVSGAWTDLASLQDSTSAPVDLVVASVYPSTSAYTEAQSAYWVKTSSGTSGADLAFRVMSSSGQFIDLQLPIATSDANAEAVLGANLSDGSFYAKAVFVAGTDSYLVLQQYDGSSWSTFNEFKSSNVAPRSGANHGDYWYDADVGLNGDGESTVDILINNGTGEWQNINLPGISPADMNGNIATNTLYTQSLDPMLDSSITLVSGDLWIDTADLANYPMIYRYKSGRWIEVDKSDQTTPNGIIFADARKSPTDTVDGSVGGAGLNNGAGTGPNLDFGVPDPDAYPAGMLLFNTRYSSRVVKQWNSQVMIYRDTNNLPVYDGRWVTVSGFNFDGSAKFGEDAQRSVVVTAMADAIASSDVIRSEFANYNLIAAPGYTELLSEMVALNIDRKETAFIIGDSPMTLRPSSTEIQAWATNAKNAPSDGIEGLVTNDPYVGVYYPSGLATNVDGSQVVVPPSHIVLRTMAYNDQVAFPWFAPAGLRRGRVNNASSVGYIDAEGEYRTIILSEGLRDVLYESRVNPITPIPNSGLVVWGQKTRSPFASAMDRVNVARLINYIRFQVDQAARPFLFEQNDKSTRENFRDVVDRFMSGMVTLRGVTDYLIVCDESNNTPARIDRNEMWLDLYIVPTKSVEFIYVPIRIKNTGDI